MLLSNPATYDARPLKEAHTLAAAGYSVTILAWDRDLETRRDSVYSDGLKVKRMRLFAGHGTPVFTVPRLFVFYAWCLVHLVFTRFDLVHCHDVDTLPAGFAAKAVKLGRPRLAYDMHDLPESFLRFFPLTGLTQGIFLASARKLSDLLVVTNDRYVEYLGGRGFDRKKIVVVMNAQPAQEGRLKKREGSGLKVLYYGWMGRERGVHLLVDAMKGTKDVTLTLAGRGELEGELRGVSRSNPNIKFLGWLTVKELRPLIYEADVLPSLYEPRSENVQISTPGKLLTSMSLGIPSLVSAGSYQEELVRRYGCGLVVEWGNLEALTDALQTLCADRELYNTMAKAAYDAFRSSFVWEVMEARLRDGYSEVLERR